MKIERMISEYENELTSLIIALKLTDKDDLERRTSIAEQITEIEEIIEDLKEEKRKNTKYRN